MGRVKGLRVLCWFCVGNGVGVGLVVSGVGVRGSWSCGVFGWGMGWVIGFC